VQAFFPLRVPNFDHVVVGSAHDQFAVVLDTTNGSHVANENVQTVAFFDVPHAERRVSGPTHNPADSKGAMLQRSDTYPNEALLRSESSYEFRGES